MTKKRLICYRNISAAFSQTNHLVTSQIFQKEFTHLNYVISLSQMILLKNKLLKLKTNKSPGPDKIHPRVLHEMTPKITIPLTIIFNTSLRTMSLPSEWKKASVSAIFKKGNKSPPKNYRPVSLTAILCKVLESIIRDSVIKHMRDNELFSDRQFGFITGRSTVLQMLRVLDIWTEILDQGGSLDIIYCDFMKAFDKVPHRRLLLKIEKYGITGNILGWISSFLHKRSQKILVNDSYSKPSPVTSGIPQGSVLGPLLFVIYINDLPDVVDPDTFIFLFADDTKVFKRIESPSDQTQLQTDLQNMYNWSSVWLLKFHPEKCVSMSMGKKSSDEDRLYCMDGHQLNKSACEKDLGIYIDQELSFDKHINSAVNKANRILAIARKTFDHIDQDMFMLIYKGLIRPHLEYATSVWSPHLMKHIEDIENVQRRATKQIPGISHLPYNERLKKLNLPTLSFRRARGDMIQVFKLMCLEGGYDRSLPTFLTDSHTINLRGHSQKLFVHQCNKNIRKYCFSHRAINVWNSLPEHIIQSKD